MSSKQREELTVRRESAVLAGVALPEHPLDDFPEPLSELRGLAATAGASVLGDVVQRREKPDQSTLLGSGKVNELGDMVRSQQANVIIFDNELLPAQARNLEDRTETKVVDRTELILDIFATRAQTLQARLQVELAQLEYARPRLKRMWTHLERHGGGIGTRGPGEQQLETDRRLVDKRIRDLKSRLAVIQRRKEREVQARSSEFRVSLVGYTNAGKSTLMRKLTGADVLVADKLFATLDTRTRQWYLPNWGKVLLSDTVGFIRKLPHNLVESFKATLEEATHADLILHVVDAANPNVRQQIDAVVEVLDELKVRNKPSILVLNKADRVADPSILHRLSQLHPRTVACSAHSGMGIEDLCEAVKDMLGERYVTAEVVASAGNGKLLAFLGAHAQILETNYVGDQVAMTLRMAHHLFGRIRPEEATVRIDSIEGRTEDLQGESEYVSAAGEEFR